MRVLRNLHRASSTYQKVITSDLLKQRKLEQNDYLTSFRKEEFKHLILKPSSLVRATLQCALNNTSPIFDAFQKLEKIRYGSEKFVDELSLMELDIYSLTVHYLQELINVGSYTDSMGNNFIRENIASALTKRDRSKTKSDNIKLFDSLAEDFKSIFKAMIIKPNDCVLFPQPSDPVYEYNFRFSGGTAANYEIDFDSFDKTLSNLERAHRLAVSKGLEPKGLFVMNPLSGRGQIVSERDLSRLAEFAFEKRLIILADESFQQVLIDDNFKPFSTEANKEGSGKCQGQAPKQFTSLKSVVVNHSNQQLSESLELISGFSISKGIFPEPALAGGFLELTNIDEFAQAMLVKLSSIMLAPNSCGQIATDLSINLPNLLPHLKPQTKQLFEEEYSQNKTSLYHSYQLFHKHLKAINSFEVFDSESGFSIWVKVDFSEAVKRKYQNDLKKAESELSRLLKSTLNILAVPGSEFGCPGNYKFVFVRKHDEVALESMKKLVDSFMSGSL